MKYFIFSQKEVRELNKANIKIYRSYQEENFVKLLI